MVQQQLLSNWQKIPGLVRRFLGRVWGLLIGWQLLYMLYLQPTRLFDELLPKDWAGKVPYLGKYDPTVLPDFLLLITIGDNVIREKVSNQVKHPFAKLISPHAFCAPQVPIGKGTVVLQGAVVQARASLGAHVIINAGAVVDHDAEIADFVHIGPGAVVASLSQVGKGAFIGAGAVVPSKSIVPPGTVVLPGTTFQPKP